MNILLLTDEMQPNGTSRHVVDLANGLVRNGSSVVVGAHDGPFRSFLDKEAAFISLPLFKKRGTEKNISGFLTAAARLARRVRKSGIEIIHTHKRYTDILGRIVARLSGAVHLSTCHNTFSDLKQVSVFGDFTIACSEEIRNTLIKEFGTDPARVATIYSGIHPFRRYPDEERAAAFRRFELDPSQLVVGSIGHFTAAKDRSNLVGAVALIRERMRERNAVLAIVGDGPEKKGVQLLIHESGLSDVIKCYPGNADVEALTNIADFFVLSSVQEGLPYVLLEAASLSKPHVATDVGGVGEFVVNGTTGILVPPQDPHALGEAIRNLLFHRETVHALGAKAYVRFAEHHSFESFLTQITSLYRQLLEE